MKTVKASMQMIIEIGLVMVITICVFKFVVVPIKIEGSSMENTLYDQNFAFVNKIGVNKKNIDRFDVAVVYSKQLDEKIIKRIIGLPGETIKFENDVLYVDGIRVEQDFLDQEFVENSKRIYNTDLFTDNFEITLSNDEYLLLGDNRLRSTDSRDLGPFSFDDFIGINGAVIYPFSNIQWMD